jgi:hypothetical protein
MVSSTMPTALSAIDRALARSSRSEAKYAAWNSSSGRKMSRTRSGSSSTCGTPGMNPTDAAPDHDQDRVRHLHR